MIHMLLVLGALMLTRPTTSAIALLLAAATLLAFAAGPVLAAVAGAVSIGGTVLAASLIHRGRAGAETKR